MKSTIYNSYTTSIIIALFLGLVITPLNAQQKHELRFGIGTASGPARTLKSKDTKVSVGAQVLGSFLNMVFSGGQSTGSSRPNIATTTDANFSLSYQYFIHEDVSVGLEYQVNSAQHRRNGRRSYGEEQLYSGRYNFTSLAARLNVNYLSSSSFALYTGLAMGSIKNTRGVSPVGNFYYQYTPLGFRMGKEFACWAEVGVGKGSIFSAGIATRF